MRHIPWRWVVGGLIGLLVAAMMWPGPDTWANPGADPIADGTRFYLPFVAQPQPEVRLAAGSFVMGCAAQNPAEVCDRSDELPLHTVTLDAFFLDKYEVTNARYQACVAAGQCTAPGYGGSYRRTSYYDDPAFANYPVVNVSWAQAQTFCAWEGKRLPTEAEWERAARGSEDTRAYPWGNQAPDCTLATYGFSCVDDTAAVGSTPAGASPEGVMDLAGNVWEWVGDWYGVDYYGHTPAHNPTGPPEGTHRVTRGGSFGDGFTALGVRVAGRGWHDPQGRYLAVGFRCARTP